MKLTNERIAKISKITKLNISDKLADDLKTQIDSLLEHFDVLQSIDLDDEPMYSPLQHIENSLLKNNFAKTDNKLSDSELSKMAPQMELKYIKVSKVVTDENN